MPCFHPIPAWRPLHGGRLFFGNQPKRECTRVEVPCSQCIGCRLEYSRVWAMRCMHEASLHEDNAFITCTYRDEDLPPGGTLVKSHFQDFLKRLRERIKPRVLRFYMCGEYGDNFGRPHYHALLFGYDFPDKEFYRRTPQGHHTWTSKLLDAAWGFGNCEIGSVDFDSAAYVARYIMKKVKGDNALDHYTRVDSDGVIYTLQPEYTTQSRAHGIGSSWALRYSKDTIDRGYIVLNGVKCAIPRFYRGKYRDMAFGMDDALPTLHKLENSSIPSDEDRYNNSSERLLVREEVTKARVSRLSRKVG